jgi:AbrB family looped-hinge helix DNA binding protein
MILLIGMKTTTVPIDQAGRIVLPKNVRQEPAIKAGDALTVSIHGLSITLTPNNETSGFNRKWKALVFTTGGNESLSRETVNRILEETRDERDGRNLAGLQDRRRKE